MATVILEPVSPAIYQKPNLEPQYTTYRDPNRGVVYLDSQDNTLETNKVSMQMSTVRVAGDTPSILTNGINRIGVLSAGIYYNIPNVNPTNNVVGFFSSATSTTYNVTVPAGFYTSATALITALVAALNTATGSSGLTFSFSTITGFPNTFTLSAAGGNFYFVLTSPGVQFGYQLWNLPTEQVATASKVVGSIDLWYTRYIDITCENVIKYAKVKTKNTSLSPNLVFRVFIDDPTFPHIISRPNQPLSVSYNFLPSEPIYTLFFQLYDQFGHLLYIPPGSPGTAGGFYWDVQLLVTI